MEKIITAKTINKNLLVHSNFKVSSDKNNINYLRYRLLRPLLKLYTRILNRKYEYPPWTSPSSIRIFDELLTKDMRGLEYGSGRSTVFFARRLGELVSIEHHPDWYHKINAFLKEQGCENVTYLLREKHNRIKKDWEFFKEYPITSADLRVKSTYASYFETVLEYPDDYFDFILIDGRARVECFLHSLPKLKKGGFIVLDNSERIRYLPLFTILRDWPMMQTTNGLTDTTFWFRPE